MQTGISRVQRAHVEVRRPAIAPPGDHQVQTAVAGSWGACQKRWMQREQRGAKIRARKLSLSVYHCYTIIYVDPKSMVLFCLRGQRNQTEVKGAVGILQELLHTLRERCVAENIVVIAN